MFIASVVEEIPKQWGLEDKPMHNQALSLTRLPVQFPHPMCRELAPLGTYHYQTANNNSRLGLVSAWACSRRDRRLLPRKDYDRRYSQPDPKLEPPDIVDGTEALPLLSAKLRSLLIGISPVSADPPTNPRLSEYFNGLALTYP